MESEFALTAADQLAASAPTTWSLKEQARANSETIKETNRANVSMLWTFFVSRMWPGIQRFSDLAVFLFDLLPSRDLIEMIFLYEPLTHVLDRFWYTVQSFPSDKTSVWIRESHFGVKLDRGRNFWNEAYMMDVLYRTSATVSDGTKILVEWNKNACEDDLFRLLESKRISEHALFLCYSLSFVTEEHSATVVQFREGSKKVYDLDMDEQLEIEDRVFVYPLLLENKKDKEKEQWKLFDKWLKTFLDHKDPIGFLFGHQ